MPLGNFQSDLSELTQVVTLVMSAILAAHILVKKQEPVVCLSWLLGVALFPLVTAIFYVSFGVNPFEKYAARKRASKHMSSLKLARRSREDIALTNRQLMTGMGYFGFDRTAMWASMLRGQTLQSGNDCRLHVNSTNAFRAIREAIEQAKDYILIQFYQIQVDSVGTEFLNLMAAKSEAGVRVHVLFDALGSYGLDNRLIDSYRKRGLKMYRFLEVHPIKRRFQINWRNHRKLVICDGAVAFTGGFNVGKLYLEGDDPERPKWFDLIIQVNGPVIGNLTALFAEDWHFTTGRSLPEDIIEGRNENAGNPSDSKNLLQVVASGPSENNAPFYSTLINILHEARERVWIMTPYFVPDKELLHAMRMAVVRGVNVKIIVPKHSNHPITDTCAHSYFSEFHTYGIELLRYVPGVCHGKLIMADNDVVLAGSSNLDYRSFFLNFETDLFIRDRGLAEEIARILSGVAKHCVPLLPSDVTNRRLGRLLFRRIMRLFAPLM
jgi:cardiolipin synthase